ncbi:metallophosphoesterase family protein [Pyrodictium occultum]|uniref:metallophosphoesterase family protein n=1 Tax=Pyrodictium occultum TaxID=2309 RepID=UPI0009F9D3BE|nr:DNA repair exonuclease [Pyrodictium occultum]
MPGDNLRVLHVSDTHLGYRQYGLIEREMDIYRVFDEIIDTAIREKVDAVVHAGDFFDTTRPPPQAIHRAIRSLRRLNTAGIPFIVIPGDHDLPRRRMLPPLLILEEVLEDVHVLGLRGPEHHRLRTRSGELLVAGVRNEKGVGARQRLLEHLARLPKAPREPSVLLLHQSLHEVAPEYELELGELPQGYSYYALGHIHLYRRFAVGDSLAVYPGSIEALRVDEASAQPRRYVSLVELAPGRTVSVDKIALETPRPQIVEEIVFDSLDALRSALLRLRDRLARYPESRKPILHLTVSNVPRSAKANVYKTVETVLSGYVLSYRLRVDTVESKLPPSVQKASSSIKLEGLLKDFLGDEKLAELASKLIDVLGADPQSHAEAEAIRIIEEAFKLNERR